jgi:hypothetical protein
MRFTLYNASLVAYLDVPSLRSLRRNNLTAASHCFLHWLLNGPKSAPSSSRSPCHRLILAIIISYLAIPEFIVLPPHLYRSLEPDQIHMARHTTPRATLQVGGQADRTSCQTRRFDTIKDNILQHL